MTEPASHSRILVTGLGLGAALGLLGGWLLFVDAPPAPAPGPRPAAAPGESSRKTPTRAADAAAGAATPSTRAGLERAHALLAGVQMKLTAEQDRANEAVAKAAALEAEKLAAEAKEKRIPFPDDLPERFSQEALRGAIGAAVAEAGGEVTAVDCSEFPCMVMAEFSLDEPGASLREGQQKVQSVLGHHAMSAYGEDDPLVFFSMREGGKGPSSIQAGFAYRPIPEKSNSAENSRVREHFNQRISAWVQSTRGPEPENAAP